MLKLQGPISHNPTIFSSATVSLNCSPPHGLGTCCLNPDLTLFSTCPSLPNPKQARQQSTAKNIAAVQNDVSCDLLCRRHPGTTTTTTKNSNSTPQNKQTPGEHSQGALLSQKAWNSTRQQRR